MTEIKNRHLLEQGEINRTKIEGYSLRSGAFYSWLKESGYTIRQIAERLDIDEKEFVFKLKTKQLFGREHLRILIETMGASAALRYSFRPLNFGSRYILRCSEKSCPCRKTDKGGGRKIERHQKKCRQKSCDSSDDDGR